MNKDIHGFVSNESFGSIPDAFILAAQSPGILYHEIFFSVLVFGNAVDNHAVVVGCFPVVESSLTHFLGNVDFRQRFAGQLFALVGSGKACPTSHVRTGEFCAAGCIWHNGDTVAGETLFAHVTAPCKGVAVLNGIVHNSHQLVDRQVPGKSVAPVVLNFDGELGVERVVCIRSQRYIIVRIDAE